MRFTVLIAVASAALVAGAPVDNRKQDLTPELAPNRSPLPLSPPNFPPSGTFTPPPPSGRPPIGSTPPHPPPTGTNAPPAPLSPTPQPEDGGSGKARRGDIASPQNPGAPNPKDGHLSEPPLPPPSSTGPPPPPLSGTPKPEDGRQSPPPPPSSPPLLPNGTSSPPSKSP